MPIHVVVGKSGCHEEQVAIENHRGDELLRRAVDLPMLFSIVRIVTDDAFAARHHHLSTAGNFANDRRHIAARLVLAIYFPERFPGLTIERNEVGIAVVVSVNDDGVFVGEPVSYRSRGR